MKSKLFLECPPNAGLFSITRFLYGWQKIFTNKNIFSKGAFMFCLEHFSLKCIIFFFVDELTIPLIASAPPALILLWQTNWRTHAYKGFVWTCRFACASMSDSPIGRRVSHHRRMASHLAPVGCIYITSTKHKLI